MEILKLMVEDIVETEVSNYDKYKVYPIEDLEYRTGFTAISDLGSRFSNDNKQWFIQDGNSLIGLSNKEYEDFLLENHEKIKEIYKEMESQRYGMYNDIAIRLMILEDYVHEVDELEYETIIYQDVNLEPIAETITEARVDHIIDELGYYGSWEIVKFNGMYYLLEI